MRFRAQASQASEFKFFKILIDELITNGKFGLDADPDASL
jgi:hypothetical protein